MYAWVLILLLELPVRVLQSGLVSAAGQEGWLKLMGKSISPYQTNIINIQGLLYIDNIIACSAHSVQHNEQ